MGKDVSSEILRWRGERILVLPATARETHAEIWAPAGNRAKSHSGKLLTGLRAGAEENEYAPS